MAGRHLEVQSRFNTHAGNITGCAGNITGCNFPILHIEFLCFPFFDGSKEEKFHDSCTECTVEVAMATSVELRPEPRLSG